MEKEKKFLYQKVYDGIKDLLETDVYRKALEEGAMTKLPSEKELCARYGVSLITLNKALRMLAQEGYVKRVPGKGTYIQNKQQAGSTPVSKGKENSRRLIGVILEHVSNSFGLDLMYFLDLFAARAEYKIVIRFSYGERERETEEIRFLLSMGVSGLIIMPSHGKHYSQEIRRLCLNNFPIVLIDKKIQGIPVPSVRTNNNEATASLVRELVKAGCTQIALISTDYLEADSVRERRTGYIEEMARQGQKEAGICAVHVDVDRDELINNLQNSKVIYEVRKFLERTRGDVDAVIVDEYGILPGVLKAMEMTEIIPEKDIRVACIDEDSSAPFGTMFLHAKQDEKQIAEKTMDILLREIEGKLVEEEDVLITGLLFRERRRSSKKQ